MFRFYNTLTRKIENFKPIQKGRVKIYNCGPTVYNYAHLGNLRAYVFIDLLKRYLEYRGFKVKHVMNITDVDDKTIKGSRKAKKTLKEFTNFYLRAFLEDLKYLNIQMPNFLPRATAHIPQMVNLIKILLKKGFAYKAKDKSVYFKISKFPEYGALAQIKKQNLKTSDDFVLWKAWKPSDSKVFWQTELGKGRPGWHIECSAMAMKYLGPHFDIHSGGVDLIFPHHTNEIAQAEAAASQKFVNYWLHNAHLMIKGEKMSKSLGNFYTLQDIKKKKLNPLLLRLILLKTHYRQILDFSFKNFEEAESVVLKFMNFLIELDFVKNKKENNLKIKPLIVASRNKFQTALDDDLNISRALTEIFDFMSKINLTMSDVVNIDQAQEIKKFIFEIDSVLGFIEPIYKNYQKKKNQLFKNKTIQDSLKKREVLRKNKNYAAADKIRKQLLKKGLIIEDRQRGYVVKMIGQKLEFCPKTLD
jgi:cysteinyl-tRNA synthetase